jgi:capsular exopolysaccharide synthesis family protein
MSTATPSPRPFTPAGPRPQASPQGSAKTIDPIKLLKKYAVLLCFAGCFGVGLGVGMYFVLLRFFPQYTATTFFEVQPQKESIADGGRFGGNKEELERFMATQASSMMSYKVLERAVVNPKLRANAPKWSAPFLDNNGQIKVEDAVNELTEKMSARPVPGTIYLQLGMSYSTNTDVAAIVQLVTDSYLDTLNTETNSDASDTRTALRNLVDSLNEQIESDLKQADRLLLDNGIESVDTGQTEAAETLRLAVSARSRNTEILTALDAQLADFQTSLNDPGGIVVPDQIRAEVFAEPDVLQLQSQIQRTKAQQRALEHQGFGAEHPAIKAVLSEINGLSDELRATSEERMQTRFMQRIDTFRTQRLQLLALDEQLLGDIKVAQDRLTEISGIAQQVASLRRGVEQKQVRRSEAESELDQLTGIHRDLDASRVKVYQRARTPDSVSFPKLTVMVPLGLVLVLGLTSGVIVLRELVDTRVKGPSDVAMIPRTPLLGMLPDVVEDPSRPERAETAFRDRPSGVFAESVRQLRVVLVQKIQEAGHRSMLIVSAAPQSGATTVATNLAEAAARADMKVLLVDANLRRPALHKLFNLEAGPGLADLMARRVELDETVCKTDNANLDILTVGSTEHRVFERLSTDAFGDVLSRLESRYDLVLIDVAPALVAGDAVSLANRVGCSVLVARAMSEKRGQIARLRNELSSSRAEFLGVVVNGVRAAAGGYFKANIRTAHAYHNRKRAASEA